MSEVAEFRQEVSAWITANLPDGAKGQGQMANGSTKIELEKDVALWLERCVEKGYTAPTWPTAFGGGGLSAELAKVFYEEMGKANARTPLTGMGMTMIGPTLLEYGTQEQKERHMPKIIRGELQWCQGYSEPNAGSDLAALNTRAEDQGDHYLLNGQKIWTSGAELADWIFCLVRTNHEVQQQKGISFLLLDITSPGVAVKPLYAFNGKRLWYQVFFEDVRVPIAQRLGEEDRGWTVAKSLLGDERLMVSRVSENKRILGLLKEAVQEQAERGVVLPESVQSEISALEIRLHALEMTSLRILTKADAGSQIGAEPSMLKLKGSELVQAQDELLFRMVDYLALPQDSTNTGAAAVNPAWAEFVASGRYHHRGYTIAGGASEVQHNIIAKQVLGL